MASSQALEAPEAFSLAACGGILLGISSSSCILPVFCSLQRIGRNCGEQFSSDLTQKFQHMI